MSNKYCNNIYEILSDNYNYKISLLVPAEEVPHGRHQDWLLEYAGEQFF